MIRLSVTGALMILFAFINLWTGRAGFTGWVLASLIMFVAFIRSWYRLERAYWEKEGMR